MEANLLRYIWKHSRKDQLWMLFVILASMPFYFLSLELPKRIVNGPIQGQGFENPDDTANFLTTYVPLPQWLIGDPIMLFPGFEMGRVNFLFALSLSFLALVVVNGWFKRYINTYKGRMGERLMRRLRFELFDRVLRYPLSRFRRTKPSEVASMIKDEVEPMGEFIGLAYTDPLFLGGQAITALAFIMIQNLYLGLISLVIILFQAWLVPRLRRRLLVLGKQRQVEARKMAGRIGEVVESIQDAHANDTTNYERALVTNTLGRLYFIRFETFQRKFAVKYINNLLIQFLAFIYYAAGGYLAIRGSLDIGQLVAVIAAYKDLPDPIRGLINYDQQRLVVDVRYSQLVEQFAADEIQDPESQKISDGPVPPLEKGYQIKNLEVIDDTGSKLIERATADINLGERVAVIGAVNSGATHFAEAAAGIVRPSSGRLELNDRPIVELPESVTGQRLAYIDGSTYLPQASIYESITYVLKNRPTVPAMLEGEAAKEHEEFLEEARRAGNTELDADADWIDYQRAGVEDAKGLEVAIHNVLIDVDLEADIKTLGLRGTLDPEEHPNLAEHLVEARRKFRDRLEELEFDAFVEPFDPEKYNDQATIGENILFGTAVESSFEPDNFPTNPVVRKVLREVDLENDLLEVGKEVASTTVELFGDLSEDNPFFDQLTYMDADQIPEYRAVLNRIGDSPPEEIAEKDREMLLRLPFAYTEARNRLGILDDNLKEAILKARHLLRETLSEHEDHPVSFYDPDKYNAAASVLDNVLLGRIASGVAEGTERVTDAISELLHEMDLTDDIFRIGLDFNIGSGGKRLSETQRQKLHLGRALLKRPDFLIVNQGLNTLDGRAQQKLIEKVLEKSASGESGKFGVIWAPMNVNYATMFDRVLVFKQGTLVDDGTPAELSKSSTEYAELVGT